MSELHPRRRDGRRPERANQLGMTVLEMLVAVLMLVVFTGVVAMVMERPFL